MLLIRILLRETKQFRSFVFLSFSRPVLYRFFYMGFFDARVLFRTAVENFPAENNSRIKSDPAQMKSRLFSASKSAPKRKMLAAVKNNNANYVWDILRILSKIVKKDTANKIVHVWAKFIYSEILFLSARTVNKEMSVSLKLWIL